MTLSGRWYCCCRRSASDRVCRTVHEGRADGLLGRRRATRRRLADIAVLAHTTAVVDCQEPVCIAVAAAVRELTTAAGRHVVEEAQFGCPARTSLCRQLTDLCTHHQTLQVPLACISITSPQSTALLEYILSNVGLYIKVKLYSRRKLD